MFRFTSLLQCSWKRLQSEWTALILNFAVQQIIITFQIYLLILQRTNQPPTPFPPKGSLVNTPAEEAARSSLLLISQLIAAYSSATWGSSVIRKLSKRMSSDMDHSSRPRAPWQENKHSEKESKFSSVAKQAYPNIKQTIKYNEKESKFSSLAKQVCPNKVT